MYAQGFRIERQPRRQRFQFRKTGMPTRPNGRPPAGAAESVYVAGIRARFAPGFRARILAEIRAELISLLWGARIPGAISRPESGRKSRPDSGNIKSFFRCRIAVDRLKGPGKEFNKAVVASYLFQAVKKKKRGSATIHGAPAAGRSRIRSGVMREVSAPIGASGASLLFKIKWKHQVDQLYRVLERRSRTLRNGG